MLNYTKGAKSDKFFEVRVDSIDTEGRYDRKYTIQVLNNNNSLKDLHLSYDENDEDSLELTSSLSDGVTEYASVDVDYDKQCVFVWATPHDAKATVESFTKLEDEDVFYKKLEFKKDKDPGVAETFLIPVQAEDSTLTKSYKVTVRRKWDPNLKSVTLSAGSVWERPFSALELKQDTFNVKVPEDVDFDAIDAKYSEKDPNYYRVTKTLKSVGDQFSYVIKVATVDRKEESKADKTYAFILNSVCMCE